MVYQKFCKQWILFGIPMSRASPQASHQTKPHNRAWLWCGQYWVTWHQFYQFYQFSYYFSFQKPDLTPLMQEFCEWRDSTENNTKLFTIARKTYKSVIYVLHDSSTSWITTTKCGGLYMMTASSPPSCCSCACCRCCPQSSPRCQSPPRRACGSCAAYPH